MNIDGQVVYYTPLSVNLNTLCTFPHCIVTRNHISRSNKNDYIINKSNKNGLEKSTRFFNSGDVFLQKKRSIIDIQMLFLF